MTLVPWAMVGVWSGEMRALGHGGVSELTAGRRGPGCIVSAGSPERPGHSSQLMKIVVMILVCSSSIVHADTSVDNRMSLEAMMAQFKHEMEVMKNEMEKKDEAMKNEMEKKDEAIAALTDALKAKTEHKQVQLTAGGEVMQLVSAADFKELTARVDQCEKTNAKQDAKLGMTIETLTKMRKESKDGRVGAPPAVPPAPALPLPRPRLPPVGMPGRRLQSSSNGNFVNELSITGPNAAISWNSHTPGLTSFNCTGVGDGRLMCSGEVVAADFATSDGNSLNGLGTLVNAALERTHLLEIAVADTTEWVDASLAAGMACHGWGWPCPQYKREGHWVYVRGFITTNPHGRTILNDDLFFTLPEGFRPPANTAFPAIAHSGGYTHRLDISPDGTVSCGGTSASIGYISLDGIYFSTALPVTVPF